MSAKLLDNLKAHDSLNRYHILLYLRAFLYFLLGFVCLGWYTYAFASLLS